VTRRELLTDVPQALTQRERLDHLHTVDGAELVGRDADALHAEIDGRAPVR
jgi:hypothetical protein